MSLLGACSSAGSSGSSSSSSSDTASTVTEPVATLATTTTTAASTTTTAAAAPTALFDFADAASATGWTTQNDTVMGGVSQSTGTWRNGQLVFQGTLSLENNGGFTSLVSPIDNQLGQRAAGASAIVIGALGDGKTYVLQLRGNDETRFIQRFETAAGTPQKYVLPIDKFEAVTSFLNPVANAAPIELANIRQVAVYLLDKQAGEFELAVTSISR
jgi:NADH dehydrogenase [ubiquinone] 1 alpha subcomplex assembly factor 1